MFMGITKIMIRLYRCAGWSKSVLYAHIIRYFSCDANHLENIKGDVPYLVHIVETYISLLTILLQTVESNHIAQVI